MAHLSALVVRTTEVAVPGGDASITLRGLSANDIAVLMNEHLPEILLAVGTVREKAASGMSADEMKLVIETLLSVAPDLVAHIIARASFRDPDPAGARIVAREAPAIFQINALIAVFELTMHSEAEVKKLIETVTNLLLGATDFVRGAQQMSSPTGGGQSAPV